MFGPRAVALPADSAVRLGVLRLTGSSWRRNIARGVCGIAVMNHCAGVLMATLHADKYLDIDIKARIARLAHFESKFAITTFAARGLKWLHDVAHIVFPFFTMPRSYARPRPTCRILAILHAHMFLGRHRAAVSLARPLAVA